MDDVKIILNQIQSLSYSDMLRLAHHIRDAMSQIENSHFVLSDLTPRDMADALAIAKLRRAEMTQVALAIQSHENAAGRPMGDDEALILANGLDQMETYTVDYRFDYRAQYAIQLARAAYAAGVAAGKGEGNATHN